MLDPQANFLLFGKRKKDQEWLSFNNGLSMDLSHRFNKGLIIYYLRNILSFSKALHVMLMLFPPLKRKLKAPGKATQCPSKHGVHMTVHRLCLSCRSRSSSLSLRILVFVIWFESHFLCVT